MISIASSFSGKPRQASMAAYRQLLAENHVDEILLDVKQNPETADDSLVTPVEAELPGILQDLSDHAPEEFREATLMAAMPMLGTLATGIRAKYRDGELNSPSFIIDIEAPQATGKSFVDREFKLLMDPIIKQDEVEWQKEIAYSLAKKDGQDVENPCSQIRIIEPNIGVSAFLERALYAKGKHLFTYAPEIETVLKNNKGGAWTEKNDLFRLAYDNKPGASIASRRTRSQAKSPSITIW